jgi:putative hemin transport protein
VTLVQRWDALRVEYPHLRIRDAAATLGVSEAELLATTVGTTATRLDGDVAAMLLALPGVGRCMALTRNAHAVSEVRGRYGGVELGPHAGQVVGEAIDLRVFLGHWRYAFAVEEPHPRDADARRRSLHVFDAAGTAVHKVYLEPDGDVAAWDALVAVHADPQGPAIAIERATAVIGRGAVADVEALRRDWDAMADTHEFFLLLRKHQAGRLDALRVAGESRARTVQRDALGRVLSESAETGSRIMIFVGNRGCIQVYSGPVKRVVRTGPWINVLDPGFNLHLREDQIASSWVVKKPTRSGVVTSLELYDSDGELIAQLFRKRDDRERAEDPAWSDLLDGLPDGPPETLAVRPSAARAEARAVEGAA